ncbi:MAG: hypothetical protein ACSHYA_14670 [Opitutaceae bacterium]
MKPSIPLLLTLALFTGCQSTKPSNDAQQATEAPTTGATIVTKPIKMPNLKTAPEPKTLTPAKTAHTVVSLAVDFGTKNKSLVKSTPADFQTFEKRLIDTTPVNLISKPTFSGYELDAIGAIGIQLSSQSASGPYNTNKGAWNDLPIYDGYLFTSDALNHSDHPRLELLELDDIPVGASVTLTVWGVGDTPDSDSVFELQYNDKVVASRTTDYDGAESDTVVQFVFNKVDGANSLILNWAQHGSTMPGFNGFTLVATELR